MSQGLYCCYCGDPQGQRISCCGETDFVPYDDLDDDMKDEGICPSCNGSGEGMHEGTRCSRCRGTGEC